MEKKNHLAYGSNFLPAVYIIPSPELDCEFRAEDAKHEISLNIL